MGLEDMLQSVAGSAAAGSDHAKVAGGLMQELESRPGGIGGLIESFHQKGMGGLVQQWSGGQTQAANPSELENGLAGTGLIDAVAKRTGLPPDTIKKGLAVVVPLVVHHMVSSGHVTAQGQSTGSPPNSSGVLQSVLSRLL